MVNIEILAEICSTCQERSLRMGVSTGYTSHCTKVTLKLLTGTVIAAYITHICIEISVD